MLSNYSIIKTLLIEDDITLSNNILKQLSYETKADCLALYFVSLSTGKLKLYDSYGDQHLIQKNALLLNTEVLLSKYKKIPDHVFNDNKLTFYLTRKSSLIGCLDFYTNEINIRSKSWIDKINNVIALLVIVYERRYINNLLKKIQEPINFEAIGRHDFFKNILNIIKVASGMQLIALRELTTEKNLECLALSGFGDVKLSDFNYNQDNMPTTFLEVVIDEKTVTVPNAKGLKWISENPLLKDVHSFVAIPIRVGNTIFGVLSFATTTYYDFSYTEKLSLESIANSIGVSITNYRNFNKSKEDIARYNEAAVSLTGLEIAQAARHEAKNKIDNCQLILANLINAKKEKINDKIDDLDKLSKTLQVVKSTLDKIKSATKPPVKIKKVESLKTVWEQAVSALSGRLSNLDVSVNYCGKEPRIEVFSDWLRHAFLNLLLNSMDAFKRGSKKRGKAISLTIDKYPENFQKISATYQDNAGGIDVKNLEIPIECSEYADNLNRLIFAPNVTSKGDEGSGWGLFLTRKSIEYHKGSIDLINHRGGVSFKIVLYKEIPNDR